MEDITKLVQSLMAILTFVSFVAIVWVGRWKMEQARVEAREAALKEADENVQRKDRLLATLKQEQEHTLREIQTLKRQVTEAEADLSEIMIDYHACRRRIRQLESFMARKAILLPEAETE